MAKVILVTINLIALIAYKLFFGGDVTVKQSFPENINAGETFTIEVVIEKGDRDGFAKWQSTLPQGFIATAIETQGATFSFKNQDVKVIWMTLPEEESFSISYEVKSDPSMNGSFELVGKFSFIEENERQDISSEIKSITVGVAPILAEEGSSTEEENEEETSEEITEVIEDTELVDTDTNEPEVSSQEEEKEEETALPVKEIETAAVASPSTTDGIVINRKVKHLKDDQYEVSLTINKGSYDSFGKIEEYLPPNFVASEGSNDDGMFSFNNNIVKILWMTLPKKEVLEIKYTMVSTSDELDSAGVHGIFSFLDNDDSKQMEIAESRFKNFYTAPLAEESETDTEEMADVANSVEETKTQPISELAAAEKAAKEEAKNRPTEEELISEITNIPAPDSDVNYRVQIAASKREVTQQYFIERHGIKENVTIEFHETWYKYTLGSYNVYKAARDKRNEIWAADNKIDDAFVTAYNSGERISVQEALMITNQKWFK